MAKTKALKQKEALARNLLQFEKDRNLYKRNAHGGDGYKLTKLMFSTKEADEDASESKNKMLASAARAQVIVKED